MTYQALSAADFDRCSESLRQHLYESFVVCVKSVESLCVNFHGARLAGAFVTTRWRKAGTDVRQPIDELKTLTVVDLIFICVIRLLVCYWVKGVGGGVGGFGGCKFST